MTKQRFHTEYGNTKQLPKGKTIYVKCGDAYIPVTKKALEMTCRVNHIKTIMVFTIEAIPGIWIDGLIK